MAGNTAGVTASERWLLSHRAYKGLVKSMAHDHRDTIPGYDKDDIETELLEVLWKCSVSYDPNNGAKFSTYFWQAAKNRMTDLVRMAFAKKRESNIYCERLDTEAVRATVEEMLNADAFSPEDIVISRLMVRTRIESGERPDPQVVRELRDLGIAV